MNRIWTETSALRRLGLALLCTFALLAPMVSHAAPGIGSMAPHAPLRHLPFLAGADLSELPYRESLGDRYYDGGKQMDLLQIAKRNCWNVVRVRLWVNPGSDPADSASDLDHATAFGKRIKDAWLKFLLDIHYSDTWVDPGHQKKPAAWDSLAFPELVQQVQGYTAGVVQHLRTNGAMPNLVQIGNEIKNGLLYGSGLNGAGPEPGGGFWESPPGGSYRAVQLLAAGLAGVRAGSGKQMTPLTILHIPDGQDTQFVEDYLHELDISSKWQGVSSNFDLIGLSYYPSDPWDKQAGFAAWDRWHLARSMDYVATVEHMPVTIVETSWPHAGTPPPVPGSPQFPVTPEGQVEYYQALIRTVRAVPGGQGVGVVAWNHDSRDWNSVFDAQGNALPAVQTLGQR